MHKSMQSRREHSSAARQFGREPVPSKTQPSDDSQAARFTTLSSTDVVGRLGLVGHKASSDSWGNCPSGHFLVDRPWHLVAGRTALEDAPLRTGNQWVGETAARHSADNLVLELDARPLVDHLLD